MSGRDGLLRHFPGNAMLHTLLLQSRRFRRVCRPLLPIVLRALIVMFSTLDLAQTTSRTAPTTHTMVSSTAARLGSPLLSHVVLVSAMLSALLSVIFFDVRAFNFVSVASVALHFMLRIHAAPQAHWAYTLELAAFAAFHTTTVLLSTYVGRRRSIRKPSVLRAHTSCKRCYLDDLRGLRHVDVLEAGTRLQTVVLALDYSLARSARACTFMVTLPVAALYLAGYATRKNGAMLLLLLGCLGVAHDSSPLLGFNFAKTVSTMSGAVLGLSVGPGLLTADEWLATADQLCY